MLTQNILVFGHKTPDTDAIASAIVMTDWLNQQNFSATAYRLGEPNQETQFLLNYANVPAPDLLTADALATIKNPLLVLTDHNESQQSIEKLKDFSIGYVIDHHKLGDLTTSEPAYIRIEPVGSTCTILYKLYQEKQIQISASLATLMVGAIISDTLNLTSPTTTEHERQILPELFKIALIKDEQDFANQLFLAKSDIGQLTAEQLVTADYKQFSFGGKKWGVAVIETVTPSQVLARLSDIQTASHSVQQRDGLDYLLVIIVDILKQQSWAVASNDEQNQIVSQVFNTTMKENLLDLGNLVSRKKQFVPALERFYGK